MSQRNNARFDILHIALQNKHLEFYVFIHHIHHDTFAQL